MLGSVSQAVVVAALVLAVTGLVTGVFGVSLYLSERKSNRAKHRLPKQWPLYPRPLANPVEREVWHWLRQVFAGYHVLLKQPFTRFTVAHERGAAKKWFEALRGAYCTYTVCNDQCQVLGCIDLSGPRAMPPASVQLKQSLLGQCGISYLTLTPDAMPDASALRAALLEPPASASPDDEGSGEQVQFDEARQHLHQALNRSRHSRLDAGMGGDGVDASGQTLYPQLDSFLGSLEDSRRAPLAYGDQDGDPDGDQYSGINRQA